MPVIVDAMGGDHAPREIVLGAIEAAREFGVEIVLVGRQAEIEPFGLAGLPITVRNASEVVGMDEHPARALRRKPDCSIRVAASLLKATPGAALVSAGHTGAVMASALLDVGRMKGIERPAIATIMPTLKGDVAVLDVGANVDCKASQLVQFAHMGAAYAQHVLGVERPRVGLLNIGAEAAKGNELCLAAHPQLAASGLNFAGNVEPDQVYEGSVDVVVTDGFAGNIFLKTSEGIAQVFQRLIGEGVRELGDGARTVAPLLARLERFKTSQPAYAGAPLLGIEGACIITHGASRASTMKHAIRLAHRFAASRTLESIRQITREDVSGRRDVAGAQPPV
jgi:glycerol-3-phosphate acyltransferase PlsX